MHTSCPTMLAAEWQNMDFFNSFRLTNQTDKPAATR
jgi:hypothetical protein